jgi:exopolyphosphatase/guanosine-5'-triphosphate,3'-diphosphate pyrophosphatase
VRAFALRLYESFVAPGEEGDPDRLMLDWAARLSEVGLSIAHAQYHKHSSYMLSHADMPGFSRMEQQRLARLVLAHRGKLGKVQDAGLEGTDWLLVFALRLSALLMRSRSDTPLPPLRVAGDSAGFSIEVPQSWLDENPLTGAALESEGEIWRAVGMKLQVAAVSDKRAAQIAKIA